MSAQLRGVSMHTPTYGVVVVVVVVAVTVVAVTVVLVAVVPVPVVRVAVVFVFVVVLDVPVVEVAVVEVVVVVVSVVAVSVVEVPVVVLDVVVVSSSQVSPSKPDAQKHRTVSAMKAPPARRLLAPPPQPQQARVAGYPLSEVALEQNSDVALALCARANPMPQVIKFPKGVSSGVCHVSSSTHVS